MYCFTGSSCEAASRVSHSSFFFSICTEQGSKLRMTRLLAHSKTASASTSASASASVRAAVSRAERAESRAAELRIALKKARDEMRKSTAESQGLSKCLQRALDEKENLAAEVRKAKRYIKRLEVRVTGSKGPALAKRNGNLRSKVAELEAQLDAKAKRIASQENDLHRAATEIEVLGRALEMRDDDLRKEGVSTKMLDEVARQQHHSHALALDLAETREKECTARKAAEASQARVRELETKCDDQQEEAAAAKAELNAAESLVAELQSQVQNFQQERNVMLEYIQEITDKCDTLEQAGSEYESQAAATAHKLNEVCAEHEEERNRSKEAMEALVQERTATLNTIRELKGALKNAGASASNAEALYEDREAELVSLNEEMERVMQINHDLQCRAAEEDNRRQDISSRIIELEKENDKLKRAMVDMRQALQHKLEIARTDLEASLKARRILEKEAAKLEEENRNLKSTQSLH